MTEVAHDNQAAVRNFIVSDLQLINTYDTWHGTIRMCLHEFYFGICTGLGTKNVAKELKKVSTGLVSMRNKKWFPQLADKPTVFPSVLFFTLINALYLGRSTSADLPGGWRSDDDNLSMGIHIHVFAVFCMLSSVGGVFFLQVTRLGFSISYRNVW